MKKEDIELHRELAKHKLPRGWVCEKAWPWENGTHLVAPKRRGGVSVRDRRVTIQLPGDGPARLQVEVWTAKTGRVFSGRGWRKRMVAAALWAVGQYQKQARRARLSLPNDYIYAPELP